MALPVPLRKVVEALCRLPGIGEKTATRLAFHLLRADDEQARALAEAIAALKREIRLCECCLWSRFLPAQWRWADAAGEPKTR